MRNRTGKFCVGSGSKFYQKLAFDRNGSIVPMQGPIQVKFVRFVPWQGSNFQKRLTRRAAPLCVH